MKHIKKFNESLPGSKERELHDAAVKQYQDSERGQGIPMDIVVGKRKLSDEFEKKAESYANLIIYSSEYSALKDMAMDVIPGETSGPDERIENFVAEFEKTFPGFKNPVIEDLATGMKIPFYGRTSGDHSRTVSFFKYLISKIQKPGYKL